MVKFIVKIKNSRRDKVSFVDFNLWDKILFCEDIIERGI